MNIEITGEAERRIQAAIASGKYASAEDFVAAMVSQYRVSDEAKVGGLPRHIDVDALAAAQGVGPIKDFRDLKAEFWPENEPVDEFMNGIREQRTEDVVRER